MYTDKYGQLIFTENDLCEIYMSDCKIKIKKIFVDNHIDIPDFLELKNTPKIETYVNLDIAVDEFDSNLQHNWFMPKEYKDLDIANYVLSLCEKDEELQRVGHELLLFQEKDMFDLLRYLKYLVDVMRKNNIVWGVGRGSSVSSYVLFLLGVHKINSLYYDLSIEEFIK